MRSENAIKAMSALAQEHRLEVFRVLMKQGPAGLTAGDIAALLEISPSSLSFHLNNLERAGILQKRRDQRNIIYSINVSGIRELLLFLTEDCCDGHPEICGGVGFAPEPLKS